MNADAVEAFRWATDCSMSEGVEGLGVDDIRCDDMGLVRGDSGLRPDRGYMPERHRSTGDARAG